LVQEIFKELIMCGDGGGGDGGDGDVGEGGYGGTTGAGGGYGNTPTTGGGVDSSAGPSGANPVVAPTGRADLPGSDIGAALAGGPSATGGGWEQATTLAQGEDPALTNVSSDVGAFGFTPNQGFTGGVIAGSMFPGMSIPMGLGGYLMGHATGGSVDDYGGGNPDFGGGPDDPAQHFADQAYERSAPDDEGYFSGLGGFTSESTSSGGSNKPAPLGTETLRFKGDSGLSQYKSRLLGQEDEALGEEFTEFTKNLF
jgi:hypothetical protein